MPSNQKDTIYIDIDDEITSIIDKVSGSSQKIIALVLPKRATVLQSSVNMKLLKRAADQSKKHIVLITSEAGLLPLAGAAGIHVASSLQSRPEIPMAPAGAIAAVAAEDAVEFDPDAAAETPVGSLAPTAAFAPADEVETIQMDDDSGDTEDADVPAVGAGAAAAVGTTTTFKKPKKNNSLKVPDFNRFRTALVLGALLVVALLVFGYFAMFVLPKATVTIKTDSSDIPTNVNVTLDPAASELDLDNKVLPAKIETKSQDGSQQVNTTGQKNNGTKATGDVTVSETCTMKPAPIDSGTGFSSGNLTFISTGTLQLNPTGFNSSGQVVCKGTVTVASQQAGAKYNLPAGSQFTIAGQAGATGQNGDAISGGTDNIVKVVAQADIDSAKQKLVSSGKGSVFNDLSAKLTGEGYEALPESLQAGTPTVTPSAQVGDQADTVTVTSSTPYSLYGYKQADLRSLILENVKGKIDPTKQKVLNDGVDKATMTITSPASSGPLQVSLSATTLAGPDLKTDALKAQIAGKKTNDVRTAATATPGVTDVSVNYSPFWVSSVPKNPAKITIIIEKTPTGSNAK